MGNDDSRSRTWMIKVSFNGIWQDYICHYTIPAAERCAVSEAVRRFIMDYRQRFEDLLTIEAIPSDAELIGGE
jgi:hypothetical protein